MKPSIKRGLLLLMLTVLISGIGYSITDIEAYANGDRTILAFTSDVHNNAKSGVANQNAGANRLQTWITNEQQAYGNEIDYMGFCGDMSATSGVSEDQYWTNAKKVMDVADAQFPNKVCYTTGNHEIEQGKFNDKTTNQQIKNRFTVDSEVSNAPSNCRIYCLGSLVCQPSNDNYVNQYLDTQVTDLETFLTGCDTSKPVFIISHYPLHYYKEKNATKGRYTTNADEIIDTLNTAADRGMTIVFLWGHNHTNGDTSYDHIFKPNDSIRFDDNSNHTKTINFIYAAAGCMSDEEYSSGSASVQGKGLIVEVAPNKAMSFSYYDANGNSVTEGGLQLVVPSSSPYTVLFDTNGHGPAPALRVADSEGKLTKPADPVAGCYTFGGWFKEADCQNEWNFAQDTLTANRTLYAKWTEAHDWSFAGFKWTGSRTNGYTEVTANYTCTRNASHTKAGQARLESTVIQPTCTQGGKTTYTASIDASISLDGTAHTESRDAKTTNAKGHNYGAWTKLNDTQHQRVCSNDATHIEKQNHAWNNGSITTPATETTAGEKLFTCTACGATRTETIEPTGSGESGGGDSGGGAPAGGGDAGGTPAGGGGAPAGGGGGAVPPSESDPVSVSDPNSPVDVKVTIQDNTATVAPISKKDLAEVTAGDVISMDVSGTAGKAVTSLCISTDTMKNIAESPAKGVAVKLDTATASLDQKMMESLAQQAKGDEIKLQIDSGAKAEATLNKGQKETIAEMNGPVVVEANLTSGTEKISQFNGGIMTLSIQYVTNDSARSWFLPDSGSKEPVPCSYTDHIATLSLSHCSHYVVESFVPIENQLTVRACTSKKKPVAVKAKKVKKAARQIPAKKYVSVRNPKGDVSYEKISGKAAFSVNAENGSITVKKGTKKGTYKLKIKVTDAGDNTYKACSKNVTCYVRVK